MRPRLAGRGPAPRGRGERAANAHRAIARCWTSSSAFYPQPDAEEPSGEEQDEGRQDGTWDDVGPGLVFVDEAVEADTLRLEPVGGLHREREPRGGGHADGDSRALSDWVSLDEGEVVARVGACRQGQADPNALRLARLEEEALRLEIKP